MTDAKSRKDDTKGDRYDEDLEIDKMHTGDLLFFYRKTAKTRNIAQNRRKSSDGEVFYDVGLADAPKYGKSPDAKEKEEESTNPFVPQSVYVYAQFRQSFVDDDLKPFLISWMNSDEAQFDLTGEITNDTAVAHSFLRLNFKKILCREIKNASDIEDEPPKTYSRAKENRCSFIWGIPMPREVIKMSVEECEAYELNRSTGKAVSKGKKTDNCALGILGEWCFLGPSEEDGCRKLMGFGLSLFESDIIEKRFLMKTRKVYHHGLQKPWSSSSSKKPEDLSLGSNSRSNVAMTTCSTTVTTTFSTSTTASAQVGTGTGLMGKSPQGASRERPVPRTTSGRKERGDARYNNKLSLSYETVLKRTHIYHGLICNFMLDRVYASNYRDRCQRLYEDSLPWLPFMSLCCGGCGCDSENDSGAEEVIYDPITNKRENEPKKSHQRFNEEEEEEEEEEDEYFIERYPKVYNAAIHAPWLTSETLTDVFSKKSANSVLELFDNLFVCKSMMTVYSDTDPKTVCWSVSENLKRYDSMPYRLTPSRCDEEGVISLAADSHAITPIQSPRLREQAEGTMGAGSREHTPRGKESIGQFVSSAGNGSLTIEPNKNDIKIEMTESLPFTCMTSGRRVKREDIIKNLKITLQMYHQNRTRFEASAESRKEERGKAILRLSVSKSQNLGIEFLMSELQECEF